MVKLNFTVRALEKLPPKEKRYNAFDTDTRGLAVAVYPTGVKSFFHLRKVQGWPRRTTIGLFPDLTIEHARGKAAELNGKFAKWKSGDFEGPSPFSPPRKKQPTLTDALEHYIEHHLRHNAKNPDEAIKGARWMLNFHLTAWQHRPLGTITRKEVRERHAEISADRGEVIANRVVTFLRTVYNHAIHPDVELWRGVNPCLMPKKFLNKETHRTRVIQRVEAPRFLAAVANETNIDLRHAALLALATGARRGTLLAMRWSEIDWEHALWTLSNPKGRRGSGTYTVPLTKFAVSVLKQRPRFAGVDWVFPGRAGHLKSLKKPWKKLLERAGIAGLTFHDLRRTLATQEGETGASTASIQKTLGHAEDSTATRIYDRSDRRDAVREAITVAVDSMLLAGNISKRKLLRAPRG